MGHSTSRMAPGEAEQPPPRRRVRPTSAFVGVAAAAARGSRSGEPQEPQNRRATSLFANTTSRPMSEPSQARSSSPPSSAARPRLRGPLGHAARTSALYRRVLRRRCEDVGQGGEDNEYHAVTSGGVAVTSGGVAGTSGGVSQESPQTELPAVEPPSEQPRGAEPSSSTDDMAERSSSPTLSLTGRLTAFMRRHVIRVSRQEDEPLVLFRIMSVLRTATAQSLTGQNAQSYVNRLRRAAEGVHTIDDNFDQFLRAISTGQLGAHLSRTVREANDDGDTSHSLEFLRAFNLGPEPARNSSPPEDGTLANVSILMLSLRQVNGESQSQNNHRAATSLLNTLADLSENLFVNPQSRGADSYPRTSRPLAAGHRRQAIVDGSFVRAPSPSSTYDEDDQVRRRSPTLNEAVHNFARSPTRNEAARDSSRSTAPGGPMQSLNEAVRTIDVVPQGQGRSATRSPSVNEPIRRTSRMRPLSFPPTNVGVAGPPSSEPDTDQFSTPSAASPTPPEDEQPSRPRRRSRLRNVLSSYRDSWRNSGAGSFTAGSGPAATNPTNRRSVADPTTERAEEGDVDELPTPRGRSFLRFGSGSSRRNGIVAPDHITDREGVYQWSVQVLGGHLPEDHPLLESPSFFSNEPTPQDMEQMAFMIATAESADSAEAPKAKKEDLHRAGALFVVEVDGDQHVARFDSSSETDTRLTPIPIHAAEICHVCLDPYERGQQIRRLNVCGHFLHKTCIDMWLTTGGNSCPYCRAEGVRDESSTDEQPSTSTAQPSRHSS